MRPSENQSFLSNIEYPQANSLSFGLALTMLIPFALGFGVWPLVIPGLLAALLGGVSIGLQPFIQNLQKTALEPGYLVFLILIGLFFACYRGFYLPYRPDMLTMPWLYFWVLFILSLLIVLWTALFNKDCDLIRFIWALCLGSLLFCVATVVFTIWLNKPPFYAAAIDIRYLPFGIQKVINTPGISNLLCLFPMAFLAALLLKPDQRPRWFWTLGILGFALSLIAGIVLGQRSYFVVVLFIAPLLVAFFLLLLRSWRAFIAICILLMSYPLLRWADQVMGMNFLHRPLDQTLFNDARFQMFQYWFERVIANPFQRIEVGPAPWDVYPWFHNFFADIHRLSGFWALLAAVVLTSYIFIRLFFVIRVDRRLGLFLMTIAIPCFLIMNTSVVPEGERQPFLLLLAIGAISEVILGRHRGSSKSPHRDPVTKHDIGNASIVD